MLLEQIIDLDQRLTLAINNMGGKFTDFVMPIFSDIKLWIPMYLLICGLMIWRLGWAKGLLISLSLILTLVITDQFCNFIKDLVARLRPSHDMSMLSNGLILIEKKGSMYGFFSGHAANSFAFAICSFMGFRNDKRLKYRGYGAFIFTWAFMVAISRVFVGKHFLGDVFVGTLVGLFIGASLALLCRFAIRKLKLA